MQREDLRILSELNLAALSARCGTLDTARLQGLRAQVHGRASGDPLRWMAEGFADGAARVLRDPVQLAALGEAAQRDVLRALRPAPVDATRADIHG